MHTHPGSRAPARHPLCCSRSWRRHHAHTHSPASTSTAHSHPHRAPGAVKKCSRVGREMLLQLLLLHLLLL
jgi:hypothetical protein